MKKGRWFLVILLLAVLSLRYAKRHPDLWQREQRTEQNADRRKHDKREDQENANHNDQLKTDDPAGRSDGFNKDLSGDKNSDDGFTRNSSRIIFTKHAKCRMGCRMIDDSEVREILQKGEINYEKSDLSAKPDPRYALEGVTHDDQHVRIIFAESRRGTVVITVIDLEKEWHCNCN